MNIQTLLIDAVALIVGIVIHESAHALAAYVLGDKTARSRGRVSLNPLAHIDPFGTVLLPLLMLAAGGPVFAFAKPVPVYLKCTASPCRSTYRVRFTAPARRTGRHEPSVLPILFLYDLYRCQPIVGLL